MHAECVAHLFWVNPFFFFFCAGRTSRTRGEWFPVHCGCGDCEGLGVFHPPLKNEDLSVALSVNFLLGMVSAGVWSTSTAMAGPQRLRLRPNWVNLSVVGYFSRPPLPPPCLGMKEGTRVRYLKTKDLLELDLCCPGRWPVAHGTLEHWNVVRSN